MTHPLPAAQDALSIQQTAATWLARSVDAAWTEQDQAALDAWLAAAPAHKLAYWRLDAAWTRSEKLAALRAPRLRAPRRKAWPILFGLAAATAAAIIVVALSGKVWFSEPNFQTFVTPVGGHKVLKLADGSQIELNTNTVVRVGLKEASRRVILEKGEAFFDIKHDATRPFIVDVGAHRVVDLGTKFVVRDDTKRLQVTLIEGKARLESANAGTQALLLTPGDVAVATATTMSLTARSPVSAAAQLGWRKGLLIFANTTLGDVAAEFNRYNTTKLIITDQRTASIAIGGTFQAGDVHAFADVARGLLRLKVQNHDGTIVISR